jgi:methionyl aminopeptidase
MDAGLRVDSPVTPGVGGSSLSQSRQSVSKIGDARNVRQALLQWARGSWIIVRSSGCARPVDGSVPWRSRPTRRESGPFKPMPVIPKTPEELEGMRVAGRLAAEVLAVLRDHIKPGVTTEEIDQVAYNHIVNVQHAIPANVGYRGFPKTLCTSVNHVICHGIPSPGKVLKEGDIINCDVTVIKDGWHGDTSRMYFVGEPSILAKRLVDTTYEAMMLGIGQVRPGATLGDIGHAIQQHAEAAGYSVVREYCGHGIGRIYHDEPQVLHYGHPGEGMRLEKGMTFTVEPMINAGKRNTRQMPDGWTVVTKDHSLSAQWEHTVAVTDDGYELLTAWPDA